MIKALFIICQRNFNDTEFSVAKQVLSQSGIEVKVSSITKNECLGMQGLKINPDISVRDANPNDFDCLVIIGGLGSPSLLDYPEVLDKVRIFNEQGKILAAICLGPVILAKAGVLNGIQATVFPIDWAISSLNTSGAKYSKNHVVVDNNIITADGPKSATDFGKAILEKLNVIK